METVYVGVNLRNLITVPLMAGLGFVVAAVLYQVFRSLRGGAEKDGSNSGGF